MVGWRLMSHPHENLVSFPFSIGHRPDGLVEEVQIAVRDLAILERLDERIVV